MKSILFVTSSDYYYDQRLQKITKTLSEDYKIKVLSPYRKKLFSDAKNIQIVKLRRIFKRGFLFYAELNHRIFWHNIWSKMDLINAIDLDTLLGSFLLGRVKNRPVVLDCHEWYEETPEVYHRSWVYRFWRSLGKYLVKKAGLRYTVNEDIAHVMSVVYQAPFEVIYNYPYKQTKTLETNLDRNKKILLYQGVLNKDRGLEQLIIAMRRLNQFQCWLVGYGDIKTELEKLVKNLGLEQQVRFLGKLTPEELRALTPKAWMGINLLHGESKSYYYSLSNKFFDYMMAGVPSLNMRFPAYEKVLDAFPMGIMIDHCEPDEIVLAIARVEQDETLWTNMKNEAMRAAQVHHWQKQESQLKNIYRQMF